MCPCQASGLDQANLLVDTGLCLLAKRLEEGVFRWPKIEDDVVRLSAVELSALLEALDWRRVHAARETVATPIGSPLCGRTRQNGAERILKWVMNTNLRMVLMIREEIAPFIDPRWFGVGKV